MRIASARSVPLTHLSLLLSVLLVILPHLTRLPLWLSAACLGAIGWRALHDAGRLRLPNRWLRLAMVLVAVGVLAVDFHTIVGRQAGSALLVMLLCFKLLEMHSQRDVTVVIFLSLFVIVIGFLFSQSIFTGGYMVLATLMLITTLIGFQHRPRNPATGTRLRRDAYHALRLLGQALPIAILLFIAFPRVPGPLWGLPQDAASARTGLSGEMEPGRISRLADSDEVAFRVKFDGPVPPAAKRYWRGPVLWRYDGTTWDGGDDTITERPDFEFTASNAAVDYDVTLEPHNRRWLFALDLPAEVPAEARLSPAYQLLSRDRVTEIKRYRMRSYTEYRLQADQRPNPDRYRSIPPSAAPKTRELVDRLRDQAGSDGALVGRVLAYFREQPFYYSREAPLLFEDPVDEFLFDTRAGFCEHYASAFTVMMRLGGVPARVVTGYHGGEMNPLSDYMIVRQSDAHAWAEVWLADQGWVRIDPTGVIPPSRIELTADLVQRQPRTRERVIREQSWLGQSLRQAGYAWDAVNNRWNQWVIGYNQNRQNAFFTALGIPEITWRGLALILAVTVGLAIVVLGTLLLRRSGVHSDEPSRLYRRAVDKLARHGWHKPPHETPTRFCQRVAARQRHLARPLGSVTRQYLQLRYARLSQAQRQRLLTQLRQSVRDLEPGR